MRWFDNIIRRAWERATERKREILDGPVRSRTMHGDLSDALNGRTCAVVYTIDNGFILVNQDPNRNQPQYIHAKDAVEVGEIVARQLTLQRMGVVQGASIRGVGIAGQANTLTMNQIYAESQAKAAANPSF